MKKPEFTSGFATNLERYLDFKESIGVQRTARLGYLRDFDRYCTEHSSEAFDRPTVEGWVASRVSAHPDAKRNWMSYIRDFGRWLRINADGNAYVLSEQWKAPTIRPQPYLLTREEIARFFQEAAKAEAPFPWNYQGLAFFALMHSCGLRTCEVRRLAPDDVNLADGYIDVHWSKGNRSRRLPLTEQVLEILAACDQALVRPFGQTRTTFFVSTTGVQVSANRVGTEFRRIWDSAGLPQPPEGKRPTPYSFRHHFAYANIERWMADGVDVNAMLPYLARYMGHASLASTYYYIHTSPDFMDGYAEARGDTRELLPKVGFE
ncbi:integrase [Arthrobacter sp. 24S4-2]|uniref:tyrosine-type recombinase/integrase n=1 Tax=Arthrobacter sp. 24S4-2 TaxID=2575374 RepID=UPI0010C771B4|nr:tyrosine-type recombinase/integrase [Arthrobacter sp. 24S4-2]QCO97314.1 integrase [Arthrobacter sp. 24S4-2]